MASVGVLGHVAGEGKSGKAIRGWRVAGGGRGQWQWQRIDGSKGTTLIITFTNKCACVLYTVHVCVCVCGTVHLFVGGGVGVWRRRGGVDV